uniref:uncharacterized protein LOC122598155 isoform X2 n=1 Tax=Erigeron canadensis TaxID=72917 RepID=UPI001CB91A12|nr:uncharacterized protein LOC122598155 isoform X2 [Erigeron canadensis]
MSVLDMGSSFLDDLEMKEGMMVQKKDEIRGSRNNETIENVRTSGFDFETEFEFWPIQHPSEPSHEDRPVECPMPHSSHLINDERTQDDQFSERKRPEASTVLHKENDAREATEPRPIRTVRKRHHDHTNTITPLMQPPPTFSQLPQNMDTMVFSKIQQVHKFKS